MATAETAHRGERQFVLHTKHYEVHKLVGDERTNVQQARWRLYKLYRAQMTSERSRCTKRYEVSTAIECNESGRNWTNQTLDMYGGGGDSLWLL
jgi:hypothetical protein